MSHEDRPLKAVFSTGGPGLVFESKANLYEETWAKVEAKHPHVKFKDVESTLTDPCSVHRSKTSENAVVFVSTKVTSPSGRAQLRVPIKVYSDKPGIVTTAHFGEPDEHGAVLWKKSEGNDG